MVCVFGLKESCSKNSDCNTKGATCINGQCDCDLLSYYNDSTNQCLQYVIEYGAYCTATDQCEWVGANASCTNNHCICNPKYRWYKGQCRPYVDKGGKCETSDDCYNGYDLLSLSCSSGVCVCSTTHYDRGSDCRKASSWPLEVDCALDIDCKSSLRQLTCTLGKCTSNSTASMSIYDRVQWDPKNIRGPAIHVDPNRISHCSADKDCTVNNTMCFKNTTCICKQGFFLNEGKCVAELGMIDPHLPIQEDSNCTIKPGKLVNSTCFCKDFWFNSENNRNCIKIADKLSDACQEQEQCKNIEHAICGLSEDDDESDGDKNLKCVCDEGYTAISGTCYQSKKHGDPCVTKSDCTLVLNHSYQCRNSICQCAVGQKLKNGYCTSSGFHISVNYLLLVLTVLPLGISRQRLF
ncbi:hypothetical protein NQ318_006882 [Aromia moschata]|uniref:EB domain-containing protein n=1 Tax=Aromia moschata TaxID=1265417 RepID=A0AAV8YKK2_9CUCU|nr:hypothetical protein NQ318_006882 [Aromia moschata]